jgi:hypothetical protein
LWLTSATIDDADDMLSSDFLGRNSIEGREVADVEVLSMDLLTGNSGGGTLGERLRMRFDSFSRRGGRSGRSSGESV